jgi:hypothetical protein
MESNCLRGKLRIWAFILQNYDFDIIHRVGMINWDANGLRQNPSSSKDNTIDQSYLAQ